MSQNLIIVESPAKMKTIKKFLGSGYTVDASMGHVRDLPKSTLGVDIDNDFEPRYITIRGKGELLASLKKEVKKADTIYLATDPDREGEAISWHLMSALNLNDRTDKKVCRITFNEITKNAVRNAIKEPRDINMALVDAQQARRIMDRVVGYSISPILWEKVKRGLSAGRVQSAALNMICAREDEINAFIPEEYWTVDALIRNGAKKIKASYIGENGKKLSVIDAETASKVASDVSGKDFNVTELKESERVRNAPYPFTTSTLQQDASRLLNFSTSKTMRIAQKLYEGVEVKGHGTIGLITYLRTDSVRISDEAYFMAKDYIEKTYGESYVSTKRPVSRNGNVQDAHEAIRPTYIDITPQEVKDQLQRDEYRLYQLIWNRFAASRMTPAVFTAQQARLDCGTHTFTASGSKLMFDGFLKVYGSKDQDEEQQDLSFLKEKGSVKLDPVEAVRHETEPPAHYTEASLVRKLEEEGIGRPSTYAPTITTLLARNYITREKKNLFVTELGSAVNDLMKKSFPDIVDSGFTAEMETKLDMVAEGKAEWKELLRDFYPAFSSELEHVRETAEKVKVADQVSDVICDKCGRNMVIKYGQHGKFLACPGFPECKNTKPLLEKAGVRCPECGAEIVKLRTKKGRLFYGCENKECSYVSWQKPKTAQTAE